MADTKRIIIGSETNDDRKVDLTKNNGQVSLPVTLYDGNGSVVSSFGATQPTGNTTLGSGLQSVPNAGTRVALSNTSVACKKVVIQAKLLNTGAIYVGDSTVSPSNGYLLEPTFSITLTVANLNQIYLDADQNNSAVTFMYEN